MGLFKLRTRRYPKHGAWADVALWGLFRLQTRLFASNTYLRAAGIALARQVGPNWSIPSLLAAQRSAHSGSKRVLISCHVVVITLHKMQWTWHGCRRPAPVQVAAGDALRAARQQDVSCQAEAALVHAQLKAERAARVARLKVGAPTRRLMP